MGSRCRISLGIPLNLQRYNICILSSYEVHKASLIFFLHSQSIWFYSQILCFPSYKILSTFVFVLQVRFWIHSCCCALRSCMCVLFTFSYRVLGHINGKFVFYVLRLVDFSFFVQLCYLFGSYTFVSVFILWATSDVVVFWYISLYHGLCMHVIVSKGSFHVFGTCQVKVI